MEAPSIFADMMTCLHSRIPAAISISKSFLTRIGADGLSELVRIDLIASITVAIRQISRMTLGPTMKTVTTPRQEICGNIWP
jgi:hypothetical protein